MVSLILLLYLYLSSSPLLPLFLFLPPLALLSCICALSCQRESLPHACLSRFFPPLLHVPPPCAGALSLFGLYLLPFLSTLPLSCLILHSSVLNALPLSTLKPERSSLLWRRRGIWIRSNICGLEALVPLKEASESRSWVHVPALDHSGGP